MTRTHYDADFGTISAHLVDDGSIEIHRESAATGERTVMQLGTVSVPVALDILTLSGEAHHTIVQRIAAAMEACARSGRPLSVSETLSMAATLRSGISVPVRVVIPAPAGNVVSFRRKSA